MVETEELSEQCGNFDGDGKIQWKSKGRRSRSRGVGPRLGEGLRASQPLCGLGLVDTLQFPKEDLVGALWLFRAPEEGAVRRMCGRTVANLHGHIARIQVELLASSHSVAGYTE